MCGNCSILRHFLLLPLLLSEPPWKKKRVTLEKKIPRLGSKVRKGSSRKLLRSGGARCRPTFSGFEVDRVGHNVL